MAVARGVSEVADSEEEPMTSSDCDANTTAERTDGLDVDQNDASVNVDASNIDHADITSDVAVPPQGLGAVSGKSGLHPELSQQCLSEQNARISEMPNEDNGAALPKSSTEEAQFGKQPDAGGSSRNCNSALQDAHRAFASNSARTGEPTIARASNYQASDCQEPLFMPGPLLDAEYTTRCPENQRMAMDETVDQQESEGPTAMYPHCRAASVDKCEPSTSHFDPQVHSGQTFARQECVMSGRSSQAISQESDQPAMEDSGALHTSEIAVHKFPTMPASKPDTTSVHTAKANSSNLTTAGIAASSPGSLLEIREDYPDPKRGEAQGIQSLIQTSQMSAGDCWSNTALQGPAANVQEASPLTPPDQTSRENSEGRGVGEDASQPRETTGSGLDANSTVLIPTLDAQHQSTTGASPTPARMSPPKTPQEITFTELKAQKDSLLASLGALPAIRVLMEEIASSDTRADGGYDEPTKTDIMSAANRIVKEHIKLLHEYNELKDVGQGLMGLIADQRGVRIVEVQDEFGIDTND